MTDTHRDVAESEPTTELREQLAEMVGREVEFDNPFFHPADPNRPLTSRRRGPLSGDRPVIRGVLLDERHVDTDDGVWWLGAAAQASVRLRSHSNTGVRHDR